MPEIIKQKARAILFDRQRRLVLIKRTRPGRAPYWVTAGGGVEPEDADVEAALHREVFEELGGRVDRVREVVVITDELPEGTLVQHVFVARLTEMDPSSRTGPEFSDPARGTYETVVLPGTAEALRSIRLLPEPLARFLEDNLRDLRDLVADPRAETPRG
ncbi:NUDIX domain-containing protein [Nocardiopsis akebiae]|uniref:NUDIX domain-containing protein n=1 Tax=Nocardiopsis akebiae TaxID=2831968 RepID=A0ABX8CF58_9ACTN|nr:NUDIX domain-containing protein [Nocardiopsis akebiae]QUX31223.1 NUDIX domain-containing protein [Nocardiopsis akebiae]